MKNETIELETVHRIINRLEERIGTEAHGAEWQEGFDFAVENIRHQILVESGDAAM